MTATNSTGKTMKAARYHPDTNTCKIDEIPIPDILDDEILVKTASASLCHSDLMLFDGPLPCDGPVTMGHEAVGHVAKMGSKVTGFKKGDRIGCLYIKDVCFDCAGCQVHNLNCELGTAKLQGFMADGFFAEYAAIKYRNAIHLPDNLPLETSAPIFCAGITAFHGVDSCDLKPGQSVVMVGCGGLGQMGIRFAKAMQLKVIGLDTNDEVLAAAKKEGANVVVNSRNDDHVQQVRDATGGGADAAVIFSAAQAAYDSGIKILKIGRILMVIGLPSKPIQFSALEPMRKLCTIRSESTGPPHQMPRALEFISKHDIKPAVDPYRIEDLPKMVDLMKASKSRARMAVVF